MFFILHKHNFPGLVFSKNINFCGDAGDRGGQGTDRTAPLVMPCTQSKLIAADAVFNGIKSYHHPTTDSRESILKRFNIALS